MSREQAAAVARVLLMSWEPIPSSIEMPSDAEHGTTSSRIGRDEWMRAQQPRRGVGPRTPASTARRAWSGTGA